MAKLNCCDDNAQGEAAPPIPTTNTRGSSVGYRYRYERDLADWKQAQKHRRLPLLTQVNVIDFDNTLFKSPAPNPDLWHGRLIGFLRDFAGGWYQDSRTLEEPYVQTRPQNFVQELVDVVRKSAANKSILTVLLTGRAGDAYRSRILELLACAGLDTTFDIICLKEYALLEDGSKSTIYPTTLDYKFEFLDHILAQVSGVRTMEIWEDRPRHATEFGKYLETKREMGRLIDGRVHLVNNIVGYMPYPLEKALVSQLISGYNHRLVATSQDSSNGLRPEFSDIQKAPSDEGAFAESPPKPHPKTVFLEKSKVIYSGILLNTRSIRQLLDAFPPPSDTWKISADHLTLSVGAARPAELAAAGGWNRQVQLLVTHVGWIPDKCLAVHVVPAPRNNCPIITRSKVPHITIAFNAQGGARAKDSNDITDWIPLHPLQVFQISGIVGARHAYTIVSQEEKDQILLPAGKEPPREFKIGKLLLQRIPYLKGQSIGRSVAAVEQSMKEKNVENIKANEEIIMHIVDEYVAAFKRNEPDRSQTDTE